MNLQDLAPIHEQITEAIATLPDADPFRLSSQEEQTHDSDTQMRKLVARICSPHSAEIRQRFEDEYFRAGPIEPLFLDPDVTEIIVNGSDSIWFERLGKLNSWNDRFMSELTYRNFIARMSREAGFQASLDCPFADGKWRDCRVHLIIPPASGTQPVVTLRRHPPHRWTFERLCEHGWAQPPAAAFLKRIIADKQNFLIVGCTGSGKTSVLNAALDILPPSERCVIIEDTDELKNPNSISSKLLTRKDPQGLLKEIDQGQLLKQSLRMRPDRIIMGEIRGGEAKDLLMAFATGHSGCIGTLHADSARQALLRLEMLVQLGAPQWGLHAVRTLIWLSLQAIVVVARAPDGSRVLEGIYRVASLEDVGFLIEKVH